MFFSDYNSFLLYLSLIRAKPAETICIFQSGVGNTIINTIVLHFQVLKLKRFGTSSPSRSIRPARALEIKAKQEKEKNKIRKDGDARAAGLAGGAAPAGLDHRPHAGGARWQPLFELKRVKIVSERARGFEASLGSMRVCFLSSRTECEHLLFSRI